MVEVFLLKEAFVQSEVKMISSKTQEVKYKLEEVDMSLLSGKEHMYWMDLLKNIKQYSQQIIDRVRLSGLCNSNHLGYLQ